MKIELSVEARSVGEEFAEFRATRRRMRAAALRLEEMKHSNHCGRRLVVQAGGSYCPKCGKVFWL